MSSTSVRPAAALGLLALAVVGAALGWFLLRETPEVEPETAADATELARPVPEVDDPDRDGWRSEALHGRAKEYLGHLAKRIEAGPRAGLPGVLADGFETTPLVPSRFAETRERGAWRLRRGEVSRLEASSGEAALEAALDGLRAELGPGQLRCKLKQVHIELDGACFLTRVRCEAVTTTDTRRQAIALWEARWQERGEEVALAGLRLLEYEDVTLGDTESLFVDRTAAMLDAESEAGRQFTRGNGHWVTRLPKQLGMSMFGHTGLALGDADGDGRDDLYVLDEGGLPNRLFLREADGRLRDVSADSGVDWLDPSKSALFVDLDGDPLVDLVVATDDELLLHANLGDGRFELRQAMKAVVDQAFSLSAADYDGDGDLDLFVCGYGAHPGPVDIGNRDTGFFDVVMPAPYQDAENGGANALLRNEGGYRFRDVTAEAGLDRNNSRFSFAAAWDDFDADGDLDLYVANDFGRNNLYRNDGGRFLDVAPEAGVEDIASGMSVAWGDYDRDGLSDVYVSNMFSSAGNRVTFQRRFQDLVTDESTRNLRRMARGNSLFRNDGEGGFVDTSEEAGVTMARWAWGSRFVDLDNDGWRDLISLNGYFTNEDAGDL